MADKPVSSERLGDFLAAMPAYVEPHGDRLYSWVALAKDVTTKVATRRTTMIEETIVFIVRLAGILTDMRGRFSGPMPADMMIHASARQHWREEVRMQVVNSIAAAYAALTEDELLWLELRRHEQSHPILDGYRPKLSDRESWDKWESKILDRRVLPIAEVIRRCDSLEAAAGGFPLVAETIAAKLAKHIDALESATCTLAAGTRL